jgi:hypothetical protein
MKNFLVSLFITAVLFAQQMEIKSLQVYTTDNKQLPIVLPGDKLTIEFDIAADYEPGLIIKFNFCDKDWQPYDNTFLLNQGYNTAYNLWYEQIPNVSNNVRYHFKDKFPNYDVTFPFSGKWKFFITDSNNPDKVYAEGKFFVIKPQINVNPRLSRYRLNSSYEPITELQRSYDLRVNFYLSDTLHPMDLNYVEVIENKKVDYPIIITKEKKSGHRYYETNGAKEFTFIATDIRPGNEYRQVNLRDRNRYQPPLTNAHYDGFDYNRFQQEGTSDFNGGFELVDFMDDYADYMLVEFEYSPESFLRNNIYLVGAFTDWKVLPQFKLTDEGGIYKVTTELKRGVYDYQYVLGSEYGSEVENIDWYALEGNFWETSNDYYIFVYYKSLQYGGYDQIIGYGRIKSGTN